MNDQIAVVIGWVAIILFLVIIITVSISLSQSDQNDQSKEISPARRRLVIEKYKLAHKRYMAKLQRGHQARQRAIKAQQNKLIWRRRRHRFLNNTKQVLQEVFPEMNNPQLRSQAIRQLISQVVNRFISGGGVTTAWGNQIRDYLNDTQGFYEARRQLSEWRSAKIAEINQQFESGQISEDDQATLLDHVEEIYSQAMQTLNY